MSMRMQQIFDLQIVLLAEIEYQLYIATRVNDCGLPGFRATNDRTIAL
jgi:hypothetical protein